MKSLSFTEFRNRASEILTLVEKGETVRIVRHGKTVAKIVPAESEEKIPSWKRPGLRLINPGASLSNTCFAILSLLRTLVTLSLNLCGFN